MKMITETGSLTMNWIQSGLLNRKYTLLTGEDPVATLYWVRAKVPHAVGQVAGQKWTFKSSQFLYPRVSIQSVDRDRLEAIFEASLKGQGSLLFIDGRKFYWESSDLWNNQWEFTSAEGERLIQFIPVQGLFKIGAQITLEENAIAYPELSLLAITGWYLLVSMSQEDSDLSGLARAIRVK